MSRTVTNFEPLVRALRKLDSEQADMAAQLAALLCVVPAVPAQERLPQRTFLMPAQYSPHLPALAGGASVNVKPELQCLLQQLRSVHMRSAADLVS